MRTLWTRAVVGALALVGGLGGCGDGIGGDVEGSVAGQVLHVRDAIFMTVPLDIGVSAQYIALSDRDDLCDVLSGTTSTTLPRSTTVLDFALYNIDGSGEFGLADPGTYSIVGPAEEEALGRIAVGALWKTGPEGEELLGDQGLATDGALELSEAETGEGGVAVGRFDVQFGAETLEGNFEARYCRLPDAYFNQGGAPAREAR